MKSMVSTRKTALVAIIFIAIVISILVIVSQQLREQEPSTLRIGYLGIVDGVPAFAAIEKGYFAEEGLNVTSTLFQTSNQLAEAVVNGDIDYAAVVSSSVVFSIDQRVPGTLQVISDVTHPSDRPFSSILIRTDSSLTLETLKDKKIALFPGSTSLALSKIAFRNLLGEDFKAEYIQMPPNLWLDSLSQGQVDAVVSYEPFATLGIETGVAKVLYSGLYEKHVMDNAPTAFTLVSSDFAKKNPEIIKKIQNAVSKGIVFVKTNENESRIISTKYIPVTETIALKMNLQDSHVENDINISDIQKYADILFEAGELEKQVDVSGMIYQQGG